MASRRGAFITFEGGEGSGKTTQIQRLSTALEARGIPHILTREPGGTPLAERIRPLVVEPLIPAKGQAAEDWQPLAEMLLFLAARVQHWQQKILPALERGEWVLCDRFMDSTLVYQGIAKGLGVAYLQSLHRLALGDIAPDITLLLDIEAEAGLARAGKRAQHSAGDETRFEALGLGFHKMLRQGFHQLAEAEPERFTVIDAAQAEELVHRSIFEVIKTRLSL